MILFGIRLSNDINIERARIDALLEGADGDLNQLKALADVHTTADRDILIQISQMNTHIINLARGSHFLITTKCSEDGMLEISIDDGPDVVEGDLLAFYNKEFSVD